MLLLITAEFQPIPAWFWFYTEWGGGLIALHRRMNTQALRDGVRNGTIDNILFPTDPVANITNIVSLRSKQYSLSRKTLLIRTNGHHRLGNTDADYCELGLFFELPDLNEIALIGIIRAILPNLDKPILKLQIAFAGIINFEKKIITFDASIFDSSLVGMSLSGDMVFRLCWGDQPTFVARRGASIQIPYPPLNIPNMRRLTINLLGGDSPRLTLTTYFARYLQHRAVWCRIDFYWSIGNFHTYRQP